MTRVAISALTSVPGVTGGSETYLRELAAALHRVSDLDYTVFVPTIAPDLGGALPSQVVPEYRASTTFSGRIVAMTMATLFRGPIERRFATSSPDVIHFPLSVMVPPVRHPAVITTIHDLQHEMHPQFFSRSELLYRKIVYGWTVRRSRVIVTISDHAQATMIERYKLAADRVARIYSGIDHATFQPGKAPRGEFLLFPANRWPHKNHDRLFDALAIVRASRPGLRLVLTGHGHEGKPHPPGVEVRGHVARKELVELYQTASAVVFPSLYEGFGLPVLEAMACGCPVAASNTTSLPEICGDAAILFDPYSPAAIAEAVLRVLQDPAPHVDRGIARARMFNWDQTARSYDALYRDVARRA
jgi:glycosyltransferase involved in cell wall biosynthesis